MRSFPAIIMIAACLAAAPGHAAPPDETSETAGVEDFIRLTPISATVLENGRYAGLLHVDAGLDIHDRKLRAKAQDNMPRLRAAYMQALNEYAGQAHRPGAAPDVERIAAMLQAATNRALGEEGAVLLLGSVLISR